MEDKKHAPRLNAPYASYLASDPSMHAKVYHLYKSPNGNGLLPFTSHLHSLVSLSSPVSCSLSAPNLDNQKIQ